MVFSTPVFLFGFLTWILLIYYLVPVRFRNGVLLLGSLLFYFWGERLYTIIMLLSTGIDYVHGRLVSCFREKKQMKKARAAVASSMIFNLGLLFFFKYWDFLAASLQSAGIPFLPVLGIHLPIGISFFTFQTMSYTIDVYRGEAEAQRSIVNFGTFVTLFPQLIAGPIIKYKEIGEQINSRKPNIDQFSAGVSVFMIGMAKKLLIANNVGQLWEIFRDMPVSNLSFAGAWMGVLAYTFQIYFDFSGYSDMATGLGSMFGFSFPMNFNYPYMAGSITEFWRRWHISLSGWFREYLYIPLGGNRCSKPRWLFNLLVVWAATGLWHGASWNFLLWGLYFWALLVMEKLFLGKSLSRLPAFFQHIYTLFLVMIGWTIFAIEDFGKLAQYLSVLSGSSGAPFVDSTFQYYLSDYGLVLLAAAAASVPVGKNLFMSLPQRCRNLVSPVLAALALLICTAYLVAGTYNPFLYFRF
ncbi:MAG: MBOAT family O-acyltransferase [Lachnospiraceae bacterium]